MKQGAPFDGMSMPAALLRARPARFAVFSIEGDLIDLERGLNPATDPVVFVRARDAVALLRWGEEHAESILFDQSLALWERQFFMQRGLMMQSLRLFHQRARFKRLPALLNVLGTVADFLGREPGSYVAALSMSPPRTGPTPTR